MNINDHFQNAKDIINENIFNKLNGHSQNNEDEIIKNIFDKLNIEKGFYVEIGINLTWENIHKFKFEGNTVSLLNKGWKGMWIDCNCRHPLINNFTVTTNNINSILQQANESIDFFSIDIDSYDWHIVRTVLETRADIPVFCVETNNYNGKIFLDRVLKNNINIDRLEKSDAFGATTYSYYLLFKQYGYELIETSEHGFNAFFIKKDLSDMFENKGKLEALYKDTNHIKNNWSRIGNKDYFTTAKELLKIN